MKTKSAKNTIEKVTYLQEAVGLTSKLSDRTIPVIYIYGFFDCNCNHTFSYNCVKHWTNWAEQRYNELVPSITSDRCYYAARLDYPDIYDPVKVSNHFFRFAKTLTRKYPGLSYIWVNHIQGVELHRHYLLGWEQDISETWATECYRKLSRKHCLQELGQMGIMI